MIRTFSHKGLERFFTKSDHRGIPAQGAARIERMLDRLDASVTPGDMDVPGYKFHPLKGAGRRVRGERIRKLAPDLPLRRQGRHRCESRGLSLNTTEVRP